MPSLRGVRGRPVWTRILAHSDSVSIARTLRSAPAIQDFVLDVLPALLSERSPSLANLSASHFREMYYDAPFDQHVRAIHTRAELSALHELVARMRYRILGFFHHTYHYSQDISCVRQVLDSRVSFANVVLADHQCRVCSLTVSADMLRVVLHDDQRDGRRLTWLPGHRVLGVHDSQCANDWQAWSCSLWHIWHMDQLETLPLPFLVVVGCNYGTTVPVGDYVNIWSTAEETQELALRTMTGQMKDYLGHVADELANNGVLVRVMSFLRKQSLRRDVLTFLASMPVYGLSPGEGHHVAASIHKCAPLFMDCLRSHDVQIRYLTLQVLLMFKVQWLADLTADLHAVAPLFDTILHQLRQDCAIGDKNEESHPSRVAIRVLVHLCEGSVRVHSKTGERSMSAKWIDVQCAAALAATILGELQEAIRSSVYQEQLGKWVGDELFDLLDCLLSTGDGIAAVVTTPRLIPLFLEMVIVRCGVLVPIIGPGDWFRQRVAADLVNRVQKLAHTCRESVLKAGAVDVFYLYLAQAWRSLAAPAIEALLASLAAMPSSIGTAFALRPFSPDSKSGFLRIAPGDQVDVVVRQGVWSYGTCGDAGGWFPACFVWPLSPARGGTG